MARMSIKTGDDYMKKLATLGKVSVEISKKVVLAGAHPIADEIKDNLKKNLEDSKYSKGDLIDSFGIAPPDVDKHGNTNTKIGFEGYDSKGVPNALKARAMESGTSTQKKKPFVRPALNKTKGEAILNMRKEYEKQIKICAL